MKVISFDWATKKALTYYDSKTDKVKSIPNQIEEFEKFLEKIKESATMLFEFGGGDTFKIMAFRAGHTVLQIPGKKIKDYRDSKGMEKSDEVDAKLIYDYFIENGGSASISLSKKIVKVMPPTDDKKGSSANLSLSNRTKSQVPTPFSMFTESDASIAEIKILYREHENIKVSMVREKNKLFAFNLQFKIARVADDRIAKIKEQKEMSIKAKENELSSLKKILEKKVEKFPVWQYYKDIKGIGATTIAGLIGELGGRQFENGGSLKHYAGMIPRNDHYDYNRYVKNTLFHFAKCIIFARTPKWRELYDNMKIYYAEKHEDWRPGKIDAYAKKFIETKFLLEFFGRLRDSAKSEASKEIKISLPAPQKFQNLVLRRSI